MAAAMSIMITQTGCFGSFGLVKTIYQLNNDVSDDGFIQSILMVVLLVIPVYQTAGFLDIVIFNLIEFWTGSNPLAMKEGQKEEQLITLKGETYKLVATKNKINFVKLDEGIAIDMGAMVFEESDNSWNFKKEDASIKLASVNLKEDNVSFFTEEGVRTMNTNSLEHLAEERLNNNCSILLASN